jgi:uncharacterized protein YodC (DUF2158 family)
MGPKFKEGEVVYEKIRPQQRLFISKSQSGLYYCKVEEDRTRKELVYFERDLLPYREHQS